MRTLTEVDYEEFRKLGIPHELSIELIEFLKTKKLVVKTEETYDPQSAWKGVRFIIGGVDLSVNGYCFSNSILKRYIESYEERSKRLTGYYWVDFGHLKDYQIGYWDSEKKNWHLLYNLQNQLSDCLENSVIGPIAVPIKSF